MLLLALVGLALADLVGLALAPGGLKLVHLRVRSTEHVAAAFTPEILPPAPAAAAASTEAYRPVRHGVTVPAADNGVVPPGAGSD